MNTMNGYRRVDADRGMGWFSEGWRLFMAMPGLLIGMCVIFFVINLALMIVPVIGNLASSVITPALLGGVYFALARKHHGQSAQLVDMFEAFRNNTLISPMLVLGAISVGLSVLAVIPIFAVIIFGAVSVNNSGLENINPENAELLVALLIVFLLVITAMTMALVYAVPLCMLGGQRPVAAMKLSFMASLANFMPLTVAGVIAILLMIAGGLTFGLGFILVMPWLLAAVYASYRDLFVDTASVLPA